MNLEQCHRADSFAHVHRMSAASLSSPWFSPQCRCLHPSPPTLHLVHLLRVSMVVLACRLLRPNPAAYLVPRLPPFLLGRSRLRPSRLGHATTSPASLLPGQSRPSAPAPGPVSYYCHSQQESSVKTYPALVQQFTFVHGSSSWLVL